MPNGSVSQPSTLNSQQVLGTDNYDNENRLTQPIGTSGSNLTLVYDGDGNRVSQTVNGQTTSYLVDDRNPTGYAQVVEEIINGSVNHTYTYGHDLISQDQVDPATNTWHATFYAYDGHGNVRFLTNESGQVTDTYVYDAFGSLITATGTTKNRYLYTGEQFDPNLGLYYLRARLMNPLTGRFWTADSYQGQRGDPVTLHKFVYAGSDGVNSSDPSGEFTLSEIMTSVAIVTTLTTISNVGLTYLSVSQISEDSDGLPDAAIVSVGEIAGAGGASASVGFDLIYEFKSKRVFAFADFSVGLNPISYFKAFRNVVSPSISAGLVYDLRSPSEWSGSGLTATWPGAATPALLSAFGRVDASWGAMSQLAKREHNLKWSDYSIQLSSSSSGPGAIKFALRANSFTSEASFTSDPIDLSQLGESAADALQGISLSDLDAMQFSLSGTLPHILR